METPSNYPDAGSCDRGASREALAIGLLLAFSPVSFSQRATPELLNTHPGVRYVGDRACEGCHPSIARTFKQTGMGRSAALLTGGDSSPELRMPAKLRGKEPGREYSSFVKNGKWWHAIVQRNADGQEVFSEAHEVIYAIGSGDHARGYLIARGDALFLSPISYYSDVRKWDLSPGYAAGAFRDFARPVEPFCVYCHMGMPQPVAGTINRYRSPPFRFLTIGCENCHGPGEIHVNRRLRGPPAGEKPDGSIVNPAKLPAVERDDVCHQCHLPGDIRIYRPGKTDLDFRPGTPLDEVVAVFSLPPSVKPGGLQVVGQALQLKMSRCWQASNGRMGCITCHDPHVQKRGAEAATFFRTRCLSCHAQHPCALPAPRRQKTSPADNCTSCHMPSAPLSTIPHTSHTNHQIPRTPEQALETLFAASDSLALPELVHETRSPEQPDKDLRSTALAHAEAAKRLPIFTAKAMRLMEQAVQAFQDDADVQEAFGRMIRTAQPARMREAEKALERAIALGATSLSARTELAELRLRHNDVEGAIELYLEAIRREPYVASSYLSLARIYARQGDQKNARALVEKVRSFDPGNPELERAMAVGVP